MKRILALLLGIHCAACTIGGRERPLAIFVNPVTQHIIDCESRGTTGWQYCRGELHSKRAAVCWLCFAKRLGSVSVKANTVSAIAHVRPSS